MSLNSHEQRTLRLISRFLVSVRELLTASGKLISFMRQCSLISAGMSRSVTHVIGYLMKFEQLSLLQALQLVQAKRPCASPNSGFMRALAEVELELHGTASLDLDVYVDDRFSSCAALQLKILSGSKDA
jgi:Dual specificity phosphatase, catalytic domain